MNVYISNISLLNRTDLAKGLVSGKWPTCDELASRAKQFGAQGMQVVMLNGWSVADTVFAVDIPVIEGPWHGSSAEPDQLCRKLFGVDAYNKTTEVLKRKRGLGLDVLSVDHTPDSDTLIELSGEDGKQFLMEEISQERISRSVVYDTWHARETILWYRRETWMLPLWKHLVGDVPANIDFYDDIELRKKVSVAILYQFDAVRQSTHVFQIQTRSSEEAVRFINGDITILMLQVALIRDHLYNLQKDGVGDLPKVVIEVPPWWSDGLKKRFISAVRAELEANLAEVMRC